MEYFEIFPWHKNFETGIALIDEQHRKLVDILNDLAAHLANRSHAITLNKVFDELAEYADYHFQSEEKIWREHFGDDEWFSQHEKTHESFIGKVVALRSEQSEKSLDEVIQGIVSFLTQWLAYHILDSDKRLAMAVAALQQGQSLEQAKLHANEQMSGLMSVLIETVLSMYDSLSSRTMDLMRERSLRKQAEDALQASETRLQAVLESSGESVWDWDMASSQSESSQQPLPLIDLSGTAETSEPGGAHIHPDDIAGVGAALQAHLDGHSEFFVHKYRMMHANGSWSWLLTRGKVVSRDEQGAALRMVGTQTDVTERELASLLYQHSNQAMLVTDANNRVIGVNPAFSEITGYRADEVVGQPPCYFAVEKHGEGFGEEIKQGLEENGCWEGEVYNKRSDGEYYPEHLSINTVTDAGNGVSHYIALFSDISEIKQAEESKKRLERDLQQAQKMESLGQLTGGIAHDFNNLLAIINGYSTLTLEQCTEQGDERLAGYMRHVTNASDRATRLVAQMLAFSRSDKGDDMPIDLAPLVKEDIKLLRASLPSTIEIRSELASELPSVSMDPTQLHQILMNLAVNARDAMQGAGSLTIRLGCARGVDSRSPVTHKPVRGDWIELAVSDSGSGIDAETAQKIFQPFFTTKAPGKGTGMGLSVIYGIMENHGGHILLDSEPGKGSTFRMLFAPLQQQAGVTDASEQEKDAVIQGDGSEILVVDDELSLGIFMEELLKAYGYRATSMADSSEALALFQKDPSRFAMLITDQTMPGMTGMELIRRLREVRPELPVILCTGYSDKVDAQGAADLDIPFFEKPVDDEKLLNTIAEKLHQAE